MNFTRFSLIWSILRENGLTELPFVDHCATAKQRKEFMGLSVLHLVVLGFIMFLLTTASRCNWVMIIKEVHYSSKASSLAKTNVIHWPIDNCQLA